MDKEFSETHELMVMLARRCAYDLIHADQAIRPSDKVIDFTARAENYLSILSPDDGLKQYRARLHRRISELEYENKQLYKRLGEESPAI